MRARFNRSSASTVSFFAFQDVITGTTGFLIIITIFLALSMDKVISISSDSDPSDVIATTLGETLEEILLLKKAVSATAQAPIEDEATVTRMIAELKRSIDRLIPSTNSTPPIEAADESLLDREVRFEKQKLITALESLKKLLPDATKAAAEAESKLAALESEVKTAESRLLKTFDQRNVLHLIPEKSSTNKDPVLVVVEKKGFRIQLFDGSKSKKAASMEALMQELRAFPSASHYIVLYFKPSGSLQFDDITKRTRNAGYEIGYDLIPEHIELEIGEAKP